MAFWDLKLNFVIGNNPTMPFFNSYGPNYFFYNYRQYYNEMNPLLKYNVFKNEYYNSSNKLSKAYYSNCIFICFFFYYMLVVFYLVLMNKTMFIKKCDY